MGEVVELLQLFRVMKHPFGQRGSVQGLAVLKDLAAEGLPEGRKGLSAGGGEASADGVSVDDGRAEVTEHLCEGGFTAGDTAGEGDDLHGGKTSFGEKGMGETNFSIRGERCANGLPRGKSPCDRRRKPFVATNWDGPKGCRGRAESPLQAAV